MFKNLRNDTCEINKLTELNYFELFEKSFNVSADKNQNKLNNKETNYDYNGAACSLNPSATMFKPRPKGKKKNRSAVKRQNKMVYNFWDSCGEKDMHDVQKGSCNITI